MTLAEDIENMIPSNRVVNQMHLAGKGFRQLAGALCGSYGLGAEGGVSV